MKKVVFLIVVSLALTSWATKYKNLGRNSEVIVVNPSTGLGEPITGMVFTNATGQAITNNYAMFSNLLTGQIGADGNIIAFGNGGFIDSGITTENFQWQVGYTNVSQILSSVGKPDGIAKLDGNGKLPTNLIYNVVVTFSGGSAF